MKHMLPVLAIVGIGILLAGPGGGDGQSRQSVHDGQNAGPESAILVPMVDAGTLPEGHPPLAWRQPRLPEGHPPLPEGHPPVPGADPVCPYRGLREEPTPGSEPSPRADDAPIIST